LEYQKERWKPNQADGVRLSCGRVRLSYGRVRGLVPGSPKLHLGIEQWNWRN